MKAKKGLFSLFILLLIIGIFSSNVYAEKNLATVWETKTTDNPMKQWNIKFNYELDPNTVNNSNIFIKDEEGNRIQSIVSM